MLVSLIIVFRQAIGAGLIVGIVLAATEGLAGRGRSIAGGTATGVAGAMMIAAFAAWLSNAFQGVGQEVFTPAILSFAVVMLSWHILCTLHYSRQMVDKMHAVGPAVRLQQVSLAAHNPERRTE